MRFSNLYIFLLVIGIVSCKENKAGADENSASAISMNGQTDFNSAFILKDSLELAANEGLVYYKGQIFTGIAKSFYPSGSVAEMIEYSRGKKNNLYKKYFEDGTQSYEAQYREGKKSGISKSWWSNGNLRSESNFKEGKPDGLQKQWYKSGAKFKILNLVKGLEEGRQQSWRENGKVYSNYQAINGRIFGLKRANLCYKLDAEEVQFQN